jgi:HD-GYP domain-containing protein (c-di-GMP phosphodiesterase class II)
MLDVHDRLKNLKKLLRIAIDLSCERDHDRLMEEILLSAKEIAHADGGTLYVLTPERKLRFTILRNDSLHLHLGGGSGNKMSFPDIPLFRMDAQENLRNVVTYAVHKDVTVNIPDAYRVQGFDFSGTRDFDARTGYRTQSILNVPLKNHVGTVIGVLQLLNAKDRTGKTVPFTDECQEMVESLGSLAAVAMTNQRLIQQLNSMLEGFVRSLAQAIDEKSEHTGNHCRRVPVIARMLADAVNEVADGPFKRFRFSDEELYELDMAALLHDCGKVVTPSHIMEKKTRLETVVDRSECIQERFEILRRDLEICHLKGELSEQGYAEELEDLEKDLAFLLTCNRPDMLMTDSRIEKLHRIATRSWRNREGAERSALTPWEIENLSIKKGTLNGQERKVVEGHAIHTIDLLNNLSYPDHLVNVPEIAGGHHERMDGSGYPHGVPGKELSLRARILAIADVFEALTSPDRPYKSPMRLSEAMTVLGQMRDEQQIDPDLYDVFVRERVFERFARGHLDKTQIDI